MLEYVKTPKVVELDEGDVITLADAARLSGRAIAVISAMLDRGSLPWYEYPPTIPGKAGARYTSRRAVTALGAKTRGAVEPAGKSASKRAKK